MPGPHDRTRVVKTMAAHCPGAVRLASRFGDVLVCVRYRQNLEGTVRLTTVELVVDETPLRKPRPPGGFGAPGAAKTVLLAISPSERALRQRIESYGGTWDPNAGAWKLARASAARLGLLGRVIVE